MCSILQHLSFLGFFPLSKGVAGTTISEQPQSNPSFHPPSWYVGYQHDDDCQLHHRHAAALWSSAAQSSPCFRLVCPCQQWSFDADMGLEERRKSRKEGEELAAQKLWKSWFHWNWNKPPLPSSDTADHINSRWKGSWCLFSPSYWWSFSTGNLQRKTVSLLVLLGKALKYNPTEIKATARRHL